MYQMVHHYVSNHPNQTQLMQTSFCTEDIKNEGKYNTGIIFGCLDDTCQKCMITKKISYENENFNGYPPDLDDTHPIAIEVNVLRFLTQKFNLTNKCPHIVMFFDNFRENPSNLPQHGIEYICVESIVNTIDGQTYTSFQDYIDNRPDILASSQSNLGHDENVIIILFQVIYTLECLHRSHIMHNDLKPDNILLRFRSEQQPDHYYEYVIDDEHYFVPASGIIAKLWDFGLTWSPDFRNYPVEEREYKYVGVYPNFTTSYDTQVLFNYLHTYMAKNLTQDIINFIERCIPAEYLGNDRVTEPAIDSGRIVDSQNPKFINSIPTPKQMFTDHIFDKFRAPQGNIVETYKL